VPSALLGGFAIGAQTILSLIRLYNGVEKVSFDPHFVLYKLNVYTVPTLRV